MVRRYAWRVGWFATVLVLAMLAVTTASAELAQVRASGSSPFGGCAVLPTDGEQNYVNAEVEPWVAVNPQDHNNIIGVWQQDRWGGGGARGLLAGVSHDGGQSWARNWAHFTSCSGGNAQNGGNYERASDPWVTFAPNGRAFQIALSFDFVNDLNRNSGFAYTVRTFGQDSSLRAGIGWDPVTGVGAPTARWLTALG